MRVLLDTNILISYLLVRDEKSTIIKVVHAAFEGKYTLLLSDQVLRETSDKIRQKKYLSTRIPHSSYEKFRSALSRIGEFIPTITEMIPAIGRDVKDDFLLAHAVVGNADFIVSGDEDLLILKQVHTVKIVTPSELLKNIP